MTQKHHIFLDLNQVKTTVDLSSDLHDRRIVGATLLHWNLEGVAEQQTDYPESHSDPLHDPPIVPADIYIQAKFTGSLESQSITYGARPDMIQLPLRSFNGWGISPHPMPFTFRVQPFSRRFDVEFYRGGSAPSVFVPAASSDGVSNTFRAMLWLEVLTEPM